MTDSSTGPLAPHPLHVYHRGEGFPILCLHGHPGSGAAMSVFTHFLSRKFHTISPDLRGYGRSQYRRPFSMQDHLSDLRELLDREGIETCLVLGWSLGGILALELALQLPERIRNLILVATSAAPRSSHPPVTWLDQLNTGAASLINRVNPGWQWNIDTFGRRSLYRYLLRQHTPRAYEYLAFEGLPAYLQTSQYATQALRTALKQGYDRTADIEQLDIPCLMIVGEQDYHITPQTSLDTARALPNCDVVCYPGVAHLFPWEIPDRVEADILAWIAKQFR